MSLYWYAGQLVQSSQLLLELHDPGLLYGATVFTTLRVYDRSLGHPLTAWSAHCDRLQGTLKAFGWPQPDWLRLRQGAEHLSAHFPILRVTLFPDGREWIIGRPLPVQLSKWRQQGLVTWVAAGKGYRRWLSEHKTGNYLAAWLAKQQAQQQGAQEAILTDEQGTWLETSTGNLFAWGEGQWWTPPHRGSLLPGIVRTQLLHWLQSRQEPLCESRWTPDIIAKFEAIAHCNSGVQVLPIAQVLQQENRHHYPPDHPALGRLYCYFE